MCLKNYDGHLITHDTAALPYIHWLYRLKVMVLVSVWVILALCLLDMGTQHYKAATATMAMNCIVKLLRNFLQNTFVQFEVRVFCIVHFQQETVTELICLV